jgi:electron transfer flavoprotein alpha subunit
MASNILVLAEHWEGQVTEATFELLALGRELAEATGQPLHALLVGHEVKGLAASLGQADKVLCADHASLAGPATDAHAAVLAQIIRNESPFCILAPLSNPMWDVVGLLTARLGFPFLNFCRDLVARDGKLEARCLLYGGKMEAVAEAPAPALCGILPGARPAEKGRSDRTPPVEDVAFTLEEATGVKFTRLVPPEKGDVDITQQTVLVSVGRGIQSQDNISLADELAKALGGAVCGSRPVIDQGWLPPSRQVGRSGATVKPRLYLALGISGAPEHWEGMKNSEVIVAVNTDPKAPIFSGAHYGAVVDALYLLPLLTEEVRKATMKKAS